jgi:hypothetical protein
MRRVDKFTESIACADSVPFSEQKENRTAHSTLIRQALFRDQVQAAILDLIRNYELSTGLSVVRVEYQPEKPHVILDAIPVPR